MQGRRCRTSVGLALVVATAVTGVVAPYAEADSSERVTGSSCADGEVPPCLLTWDVPSQFVDPNRALVHTGELNTSERPHEDGGVLRRSRELKLGVHLPAGYDGEQRFPVLYLLHGSGGNYTVWSRFHGAESLLRDIPAVVVMPEGGSNGFYANWWDGGRGAEKQLGWERYHLEEVIPLVEQKLKILPGRRWRAIFGFSMGATGAIRYAAQCPGCFGTVGSLSGALDTQDPIFSLNCAGGTLLDTATLGARAAQDPWCLDTFGNPATQKFYWSGHNPLRLTSNLRHTRVYVAHGDGIERDPQHLAACAFCEAEFAAMSARFVDAARADGVTVEHNPHGGGHSPVRATADLARAIEWGIFEDVDETPGKWTFKTVSQHGRMWDLDYEFERPPDEVITFERDGNFLTGVGSGTVAIRASGGGGFTATLPFRVSLPTGRAPSRSGATSGQAPAPPTEPRRTNAGPPESN